MGLISTNGRQATPGHITWLGQPNDYLFHYPLKPGNYLCVINPDRPEKKYYRMQMRIDISHGIIAKMDIDQGKIIPIVAFMEVPQLDGVSVTFHLCSKTFYLSSSSNYKILNHRLFEEEQIVIKCMS